MASSLGNAGLEVHNLNRDTAFLSRRLHHPDPAMQIEGLWRLGHAFLHTPETILQELSDTAIYLCGADSAGISIEQPEEGDQNYYLWAAVSGQFSPFRRATLPRYPSACSECIQQGTPQSLKVTQKFYDLMCIEAPPVTDGILIPWSGEKAGEKPGGKIRGTIWVLAHGRDVAFDREDLRLLQLLANFTSMAIEANEKRRAALEQVAAATRAATRYEVLQQLNFLQLPSPGPA